MRKVLISFIGTGKKAEGGGVEQYEEAIYQFPNGFKKKSSLITSVLFEYINPDKVIIIGTSESIWSELSNIDPDKLESLDIYEKIWEETWSKQVSKETLLKWEEALKETLGKEFSLNLLSSEAREEIIEVLYRELPKNSQEVYLDITHSFRHFPLIASFSLPVFKYIKNFQNIILVYGKLTKGLPSPVYFLNIPNKLMNLLEAISLMEHSGNFAKFSEIYNNDLFSQVYLKTETNRSISKKKTMEINKILQNSNNIYQQMASEIIDEKVIPYLKGESLEVRMAKRAVFFAERKQFLKAYTLIYEAILTAGMKKFNLGDYNNIDDRRNASLNLPSYLTKEDRKSFQLIRNLRNVIIHGSQPRGRYSSEIISILDSEEQLKNWILKGKELLEKILKS